VTRHVLCADRLMLDELEFGERWDAFCALPPDPRSILDVGCGSGMGFQSLRRRGVRVVGVDHDRNAIATASQRLDEALLMDVETQPWPDRFLGTFDVVAFCDCIEHLADPWRTLASVRSLLSPAGIVIASIPNLRQWRLIVKLALGKWDYVSGAGTVQRGHLRFFTRRTIIDMFLESGYQQPNFFFPPNTFHLQPLERTINRLTFGRVTDLLYGSHTVSAMPKR